MRGSILLLFILATSTSPYFWYPLRWQDSWHDANEKLCLVLDESTKGKEVAVIQSANGALEFFCDNNIIVAPWAWPSDFLTKIKEAPSGTLVLLSADAKKYLPIVFGNSLVNCIYDNDMFELIWEYQAPNVYFSLFYLAAAGKSGLARCGMGE